MNESNNIKKFIADMKCRRCGQHYELDNIDAVGRLADLLLFTIYCPSCNKTVLAIVDIKGDKETKAATDLTEAEKSHFSVPIGSSDILDMHSFLKDFNGDFAALFTIYS